jgi:hypothetical protein
MPLQKPAPLKPAPDPIEQGPLWHDEQRKKLFQSWLEGISERFYLDR